MGSKADIRLLPDEIYPQLAETYPNGPKDVNTLFRSTYAAKQYLLQELGLAGSRTVPYSNGADMVEFVANPCLTLNASYDDDGNLSWKSCHCYTWKQVWNTERWVKLDGKSCEPKVIPENQAAILNHIFPSGVIELDRIPLTRYFVVDL